MRCFSLDRTVTEAAQLSHISVRSVNNVFLKRRLRIVAICTWESPVEGMPGDWGGERGGGHRATLQRALFPEGPDFQSENGEIKNAFSQVAAACDGHGV